MFFFWGDRFRASISQPDDHQAYGPVTFSKPAGPTLKT
jgi:hypothetical protein